MMSRVHALARSELGRRLTLATASSGVIWIGGTLATFAVGVLLARWLGPAGYGVYGSAVAIVTLLAVPAQLGLPLLATREVSAAYARGRAQDAATLAIWFVALVVLAAVLIGAALHVAAATLPLLPALGSALAAAAWLLPGLALSALAVSLLRGQERVVASQALDVLVRPLLFVAALVAAARPFGPSAAIGAQALAAGGIALIGLALFAGRVPRGATRGTRRVRAWAAAALPMTLLEVMRALDGSYGVLIAGYAASIADAGLFRVAASSVVIVTVPISLQTIVIAPFLAGAHAAGERGRLARLVAGSTIFMTAAVGGLTLALALVGRWAVPFAFGDTFAGAYWPLMVLSCNQLLAAMLGPSVILLSMTGHERAVATALSLSVGGAILAALVLTPRFGAVGTAASTLLATIIRGVLLNRHARATLGIDPSLGGATALLRRDPGMAR